MKNTTGVPAQSADLLELLFTNRNRNYGAYLLRRNYPQYLARAVGIGFLLIVVVLVLIDFAMRAGKSTQSVLESKAIIYFTNFEIPKAKPIIPPPLSPQAALPPATRSALRFVPPIVQPDRTVPEVMDTQTQEQLATSPSDIGATSIDGSQEAQPTLSKPKINPAASGVLEHPQPEPVYEPVEVQKMPSFPGGEGELLKYLSREIRYPVLARESGVEGPVVISLVIDEQGNVSDIQLLKDPGAGLGKEAIRVVTSMPKWYPGEANGHPVKVRFYLPVRFELN